VPAQELDGSPPRLRGANRRLAQALEQLRSGVPLNWGQVEDDPEMATLARLQQAGEESRLMPLREPSSEMKVSLVNALSARLPRPVVKPQKAVPKTMAGFSESVPVLTQVEDEVDVGVNWPVTLLRGAIVLVVVALVIWGLSSLIRQGAIPTYQWIQALQTNVPVTQMQRKLAANDLPCKLARSDRPFEPVSFEPVQALRDAQADVGFNIPMLPVRISAPVTATFQLSFINVAPCDGATLRSGDPGAAVAMQYRVNRRIAGPTVTPQSSVPPTRSNIPGQNPGGQTGAGFITMFVVNAQPSYVDVTSGSWHEVRSGNMHGLYWSGEPYTDLSGAQWMGDTSVLMLEHGDTVVTIVGSNGDGISEDLLEEAGAGISW
jgi:hypothetical protein